ncbi:hypothetical protein B6I21_06225 [candidate division KSB1 bacterium 4572_119]|nr:MAG: hypothetical protein B6I21_06225 [candidate division KSB1 bacterium 4572_119]
MLKRISTLDAVIIVLMAACGLAVKPVINPLFKLITSAFLISSGSVSGVIYMIFPMLALLIVRQPGSATMTGLIQGIIVLLTGIYGSHGIISILTYIAPGILIDFGFYLVGQKKWLIFFPTALGNLGGNFLVGTLFLRLPTFPLILTCVTAFILGSMSGFLSWNLYHWLVKHAPVLKKDEPFN